MSLETETECLDSLYLKGAESFILCLTLPFGNKGRHFIFPWAAFAQVCINMRLVSVHINT